MTQSEAKRAANRIPFEARLDRQLPPEVENGLRRVVNKQLRHLVYRTNKQNQE